MNMPTYDARVTAEIDRDGIALVTVSNPPMNAMHPNVISGIAFQMEKAQDNPSVKAIILTGANGLFSAGFDVSLFRESRDRLAVGGDGKGYGWVNEAFCDLVESGPKPTVAAINGVALGGGCELAIACNARICTPKSRIGLPELQLGIIPGFGGTQRLHRLVGLPKAMEMMLLSKPVSGSEAQKLGLVDGLTSPENLIDSARDLALNIVNGRRPRLMTLYRTDKTPPLGEAISIIGIARSQAAKRAKGLQHPQFCLESVQYGIEHGGRMGLIKETELFQACLGLDTHKALVHVFFAMRATKRVKGVTDTGRKPRAIKRVAVLGGGLMGSGIATSLALAGYDVLLKEINEKFLQDGLSRIQSNMQSQKKKGSLKEDQAASAMSRIKGVLTYDEFWTVDMVIEAVIEDIALKQRIFVDLEKACSSQCILSSNTSTINLDLIGAKTRSADRIVGAHFFSPAHIMPLLEIVRSQDTSPQVLLDTLGVASKIKKTPVIVGNCTGFCVNRVFFPYTMAAALLIDLGMNPYRIDKVIQGKFGMPLGPFRLSDLVGADIGLHVGKNFVDSFPERVYRTQLFVLMNKYGRLGEKTKKGFYKFSGARQADPDPELEPILAESKRLSDLRTTQPISKMSDQDIIDFLFFPVVNEGCRVISENIVDKPADLDVASILGMGFPAPKGGLIFWADLVGARHIHDKLTSLAQTFPQVEGFFTPCRYLSDCARAGWKLENGGSTYSKM